MEQFEQAVTAIAVVVLLCFILRLWVVVELQEAKMRKQKRADEAFWKKWREEKARNWELRGR